MVKTAYSYDLPFLRYSPKEVASFKNLGRSFVSFENWEGLGLHRPVGYRPQTTANQQRVSLDTVLKSRHCNTFHSKTRCHPARSRATPFGNGTVVSTQFNINWEHFLRFSEGAGISAALLEITGVSRRFSEESHIFWLVPSESEALRFQSTARKVCGFLQSRSKELCRLCWKEDVGSSLTHGGSLHNKREGRPRGRHFAYISLHLHAENSIPFIVTSEHLTPLFIISDRAGYPYPSLLYRLCRGLVACWCNGEGVDWRLKRSPVRLPAVPLLDNNLGQVVHTHFPLSPSSIG